MIVIDIETGQPHKVWKYLLSGNGQESVWCHDWYGHHIIGSDCEFVGDTSTKKNELVIPDVSQRSELLLSAICQFTKRNTQKEIQEVERWIETDFRK